MNFFVKTPKLGVLLFCIRFFNLITPHFYCLNNVFLSDEHIYLPNYSYWFT